MRCFYCDKEFDESVAEEQEANAYDMPDWSVYWDVYAEAQKWQ